ncbi:hypothetical protein [Providencia sp. VP23HZSY-1]|uniref:hypothetical protein n=1 Tax=Providencia sp. VP23HZSY-1 TaxID=3391806 RepID=UPI003AF9C432
MSNIIDVKFYRIVKNAKYHTHYSNLPMVNFTEQGLIKELEKRNKGCEIELIKYTIIK